MPAPSADLRFREAERGDATALSALHVASWRETYAGLLPHDRLAGLEAGPYHSPESWRETLAGLVAPAGVVVVEHTAHRLAAFAEFGPNGGALPDYRGTVSRIYLRGAYQGRGIGRRLMGRAARRLGAAGLTPVIVWVLESNRVARRFYERLGGVEAGRHTAFVWRDAPVPEIAYAWPSAAALMERAGRRPPGVRRAGR